MIPPHTHSHTNIDVISLYHHRERTNPPVTRKQRVVDLSIYSEKRFGEQSALRNDPEKLFIVKSYDLVHSWG